ncbi:MAG: hypothetical protein KDC05_13700 [Bacteroidales bacterium]|nr:hypothetical protein [Bacteroidales bacterium]
MKNLIAITTIALLFCFSEINAQNAPVTTAGVIVTYGPTLVLPVTVTDFTDIGSFNLRILYDPAIINAISVSKGPQLVSGTISSNLSGPGIISLSWYTAFGVSLPNNSVLVNITFEKVAAGTSAITFENDPDYYCRYRNSNLDLLNDLPTSTYYINGSVTILELIDTEWTGNFDSDWSTSANWTNGVPDETKKAVVPDVSPNPFPDVNLDDAICNVLQIESGTNVHIKPMGALTVLDQLDCDGEFLIESTVAGDGSFINGRSISGTGTVSVERYITSECWHYISPPVTGILSGVYLDLFLIEWDEPAGEWSNIVPEDIPLNVLEGFGTWASDTLTGTTTIVYESDVTNLNYGTYVSGPLSSNGPDIPVGESNRGYNFIGNPYPSAVDWDLEAGWSKSWLDDAIYIWNSSTGNYGSYVNGSSNNDVTNIIPAGQGFFVHNNFDGYTTVLSINNSARLHDAKPFIKKGSENQPGITFSIESGINSFSDEVVIAFNEEATNNFDPAYDALNLNGDDEAPDLFTVSEDMEHLSIQAFPLPDENDVIPLGLTVGVDGIYTLWADGIETYAESGRVVLFDQFENVSTDLNIQNNYSFFASSDDPNERFSLLFEPDPGYTREILSDGNVMIYAIHQKIAVKSKDGSQLNGKLVLYDLLGRTIQSHLIQNNHYFETSHNTNEIILASYYDQKKGTICYRKIFTK